MTPRSIALTLLAGSALLLAACSSDRGDFEGEPAGSITVVGASSLTDAMGAIAADFEDANPGVDVHLSFDGSSALVAAIEEGAPVDLVAIADTALMDRLAAGDHLADDPVAIATNRLTIVVADGNPARVTGLEDLTSPELLVALCRPEVPCGGYAHQLFSAAGLEVPRAGLEANVRAVLSKVALGEADAGIVYASDVRTADGVEAIDPGEDLQVAVSYPAAVLADADHPQLARAFLAHLTDERSRTVLSDHGFGLP